MEEYKSKGLVMNLSKEDKVNLVMENVSIFDVFSEEDIKEMLRQIRLDEIDRLKEINGLGDKSNASIIDMQFRLVQTELEIKKDAISYALYASNLSLRYFLEEFESYVENVVGYQVLDKFIHQIKDRLITIN